MKDATVRATGHPDSEPPQSVTLRLYVARTTPNSRRAEQNLMTALKQFEVDGRPVWRLEVVDVFYYAKASHQRRHHRYTDIDRARRGREVYNDW